MHAIRLLYFHLHEGRSKWTALAASTQITPLVLGMLVGIA